MKIKIKKEVFKKFPDIKIAFILTENVDNKKKLKESIHLLQEMEQLIRLTFNKETIKNHYLIAPWAVAQQEFGKNAKHHHTSVERLLKNVLAQKSITTKDVITNLLRYLALKHIVPLGVDDYQKINGDLTFSLSSGKEKVDALRNIKKGALYYKDKKNVLGTKLDFWKSNKTALNKKSTSALIHFDILPPINKKKLNELVKETKELVTSFCGGKVEVVVLDKTKSSANV